MQVLKRLVKKVFNTFGYKIVSEGRGSEVGWAEELSADEVKLIEDIRDNEYTMAFVPRLVNTLKSCKYVVENKIPGDFVE